MKISETMNLVSKIIPSLYQKPRAWVPDPMKYPVTVHILSDKDFEIAARTKKFNRKLNAFSLWETVTVGEIYIRHDKIDLFSHEIRYLQKGHSNA